MNTIFASEGMTTARRVAGILGLSLALAAGSGHAQEQPVTVETLRLEPGVAMVSDVFFGSVRASEIASLSYAARGCIVEVSEQAKHDREVSAGQVLVRLDDQRARLALRTAEARLSDLAAALEERRLAIASARADERRRDEDLAFVTEEFERSSAMLGRGLINESTMDAIERRFMEARFAAERAKEGTANAEAAAKRAEIALDIGALDKQTADLNLADVVLRAPFDGILVGFDPNPGECVQEGELAARVYVPDQKSVDVFLQIGRLTEPRAGGLQIGSGVQVTRVNGQDCGGTITRIDTEADLENQYVEVTVDVDPACAPNLYLNESVEVAVRQNAGDDAYAVPNGALALDGTAFLVDEDSLALVAVRPELIQRGAEISIVRLPAAAGRLLVAGDLSALADGMAVRLAEQG